MKNYLAILLMALCVVSCSKDKNKDNPITVGKNLTINSSSYADWTYVNLKTGETQTVTDYSRWYYTGDKSYSEPKAKESDIKIEWHIAFHRYNVRTNGASAVATTSKELAAVTSWPSGGYVSDVQITPDTKVITDLSGMMQGNIGYASSGPINEVLGTSVTRSGSMGAFVYTVSDFVYVVKFTDGGYAKIKFLSATSNTGASGYVTFAYEYVK